MNNNCLKDIMCPRCGHTESFNITVDAVATVFDDGVDKLESENEWDGNSAIVCRNCQHQGQVIDFAHPGFFVTFEVVNDRGEDAHRGWWLPGGWMFDDMPGEQAFSFDPDDVDDCDKGDHGSIGNAIVEWAVELLRREGAHYFSGTDWFSTESEFRPHDGSRITRNFHFDGFSTTLRERVTKELTT